MAEIGKNIIENLTTAMYENSYTVFREYIQNSADSIDKAVDLGIMSCAEATIDIHIETSKRRITIHDNAAGISMSEFYKKLSDIADSQKDPSKEKGFRGIGRLAGLAYCDKLIFRTSSKGENIESTMVWDGKKMRGILSDSSKHPSASELIDSIIACSKKKCDSNSHFFEVILEDVIQESDDLLDDHEVLAYLQAVAPVPYANTFTYKSKIYAFAKQYNLTIDEYDIQINGNPIFKPYINRLYEGTRDTKSVFDEVSDIEFRHFYSNDNHLLGWLWFAVTKYEKQIPIINPMRGIRIRKENIQIGNGETLSYPKFYKEPRGNYYFIGELFAVNSNLRPNARRDYFNTNSTLKEFEYKVKPVFYKEFYDLYHYANKVKSSFKKANEYQKKHADFEEKIKKAGFVDNKEQEEAVKELNADKDKVQKAIREIELRQREAIKNPVLSKIFNEIEKTYMPIDDMVKQEVLVQESKKSNKKYLSQSLSKYNKHEQKLISKIYSIIKVMLPKDIAEMIVNKIQEELSK